MKLAKLSNAPRDKFPIALSNEGRSHEVAQRTALLLSVEWNITLTYEPDFESKQGTFYLDASSLSDLEIEGVYLLVPEALKRHPQTGE